MTAYADYAYYTGTYLGTAIAEADFDRLALSATAVIDRLTFGRAAGVITADEESATIDKIQMAMCAVAEELAKQAAAGGAIQSERVGSVSVTYALPRSPTASLAQAAALYLADTDLMYRGFNADER